MRARTIWVLTIVYGLMFLAGGGYFAYVMIFEHLTIEGLFKSLTSGTIERPDVLGSLFAGLLGFIGLGQMIARGLRKTTT